MSTISYRANLSAATYPMTVSEGGRTVIIPGPDNNYDRRLDPQGEQRNAGIPQALYLENVVPTANGYQSVGYLAPTAPMTVVPTAHIVQVIEIPATISFVGPTLYPFALQTFPLFVWSDGSFTAGNFGNSIVTFSGTAITDGENCVYSTAIVRGICYLYAASGSTRELYTVTATLGGAITLTNVTAAVLPANFLATSAIISVCASNNYLVAHDNNTVYWSSTTTPTDFTSSLVSGAGQIDPNNAADALAYIKETTNGFYVYADNTIIYAQYTGNSRYPFKFNAVTNSTGLHDGVRWELYGNFNSDGHYVIEKNRTLKFLQGGTATPIGTEVTDFLAKNPVQLLFNYATNVFTASITQTAVPSIYVYMSRYVLVSVNGTNTGGGSSEKYTHVIIYDMQLRRYGRLKLDHSFMFSAQAPNEVVGFVNKQANTIKFLSFDIFGNQTIPFAGVTPEALQGVLVLGKFQYVRSRMIQLHEVELEGIQDTAIIGSPNIACVLLPSLDGNNFSTPVALTAAATSGTLATYPAHHTAKNVSLAIKGAFNLSTVQLKFSPRGDT